MRKRNEPEKRVSRSRGVMYQFESVSEDGFPFDVEERLAKAKADGIIFNYDDGRDRWPWFEGKPGEALRALRDEFLPYAK